MSLDAPVPSDSRAADAGAPAHAPALRLPRHLLAALAQPLESEEDVHKLIAQIRVAEYRGLL
jgi:hypothetical protein